MMMKRMRRIQAVIVKFSVGILLELMSQVMFEFNICHLSSGVSLGSHREQYSSRANTVYTTEKIKCDRTINTMYRYFIWFHFRQRKASERGCLSKDW